MVFWVERITYLVSRPKWLWGAAQLSWAESHALSDPRTLGEGRCSWCYCDPGVSQVYKQKALEKIAEIVKGKTLTSPSWWTELAGCVLLIITGAAGADGKIIHPKSDKPKSW